MNIFSNLNPGDIAIDCGANIGEITEKMAAHGATVYAFEPNPCAYAILEKRFAQHRNVTCIRKGVWDKNGKMKLYLHQEYTKDPVFYSINSSIFSTKYNVNPNHFEEIDIIDLTEFIVQINRKIKLIKIDIEGAEYDLLEKMINMKLHLQIEQIVVETHADRMPELQIKDQQLRKCLIENKIENINLSWI